MFEFDMSVDLASSGYESFLLRPRSVSKSWLLLNLSLFAKFELWLISWDDWEESMGLAFASAIVSRRDYLHWSISFIFSTSVASFRRVLDSLLAISSKSFHVTLPVFLSLWTSSYSTIGCRFGISLNYSSSITWLCFMLLSFLLTPKSWGAASAGIRLWNNYY